MKVCTCFFFSEEVSGSVFLSFGGRFDGLVGG